MAYCYNDSIQENKDRRKTKTSTFRLERDTLDKLETEAHNKDTSYALYSILYSRLVLTVLLLLMLLTIVLVKILLRIK
jgi:hypothetical protein